MKKRIMIAASLASLLFVSSVLSVTSLAWFTGRDNVITNAKLGGSVLQSYFHAGNGSEEHPFTITTPWHYENFVKLHYNVTGFAEKGYYFEFGDTILGSATPIFFYTDSNGIVDRTRTSATLNLGGMELMPLGTSEQPFFAQLDGNGLTVTHFTINGEGYSDIGIFGFVSSSITPAGKTQRASIKNCYWGDFVISTQNSDSTKHTHEDAESIHTGVCEVGYLAGHVVEAASFENCYVNNCDIKAKSPAHASNTSYGYYGKAEKDAIGGSTGKGQNYQYLLDSEAIYRSVRAKYNNVANFESTPIRARKEVDSTGNEILYTEYDTPLNGVMPETTENGTKTIYPITTALQKSGNEYRLLGNARGTSADRNYSFSTLGYQPLTSNSETQEYEAVYQDNGSYVAMPKTTTRNTSFDNKDIKTNVKDDLETIKYAGDWYYWNSNSEWRYIHSENDSTTGTEAREFTINLSMSSEYTRTSTWGGLKKPSIESATIYLYIDGVKICEQDISSKIKVERTSWSTKLHFYNISLNTSSYNRSLCRGTHYYCFFLATKCSTNQIHYSWLKGSDNGISIDTDGKLTGTAGTFNVTQDLYDSARSARSITLTATSSGHGEDSDSGLPITIESMDTRAHNPATDIPAYVTNKTYQKTLYGIDQKDETKVIKLADSTILWKQTTGTTTEYDEHGNPIEVPWYKWIAYYTPSLAVDYNTPTVYFADDPDIRPHMKESTYVPGYEWRNIDIVGGGISFYYRNFPILGLDIRVISIAAESSSNYVCKSVPAADIGKRFYATKYCPCSIVLYLKNTANAADESDHTLGTISFQYMNIEIGGSSYINLSKPSFKKGNGVFIDLTEFGTEVPGGGTVDYRTTFKCTIDESGAKECSYCALDKDGNILGMFDNTGKPSTGLIDAGGKPILEKLLAIDTYVLTLGTSSNLDINTWVTKIDFEYKAKEGYGGTFGTVGYRDASDVIDSTILNIFFNLQELVYDPQKELNFSMKVVFQKLTDSTYKGVYNITCTSSVALSVNVFNYDTTNYYIKFNGADMTSSDATFNIDAS